MIPFAVNTEVILSKAAMEMMTFREIHCLTVQLMALTQFMVGMETIKYEHILLMEKMEMTVFMPRIQTTAMAILSVEI